jgi:hypothetical protein
MTNEPVFKDLGES